MFLLADKIEELGFNLSEVETALAATFRGAIYGIAKAAQAEWIRLAQSRLASSRVDYINGLRQAESFSVEMVEGEPVYIIQLVGRMPNNFEYGMAAFDMKSVHPGWLWGKKSKVSKSGHRFVTIPFRHSTSSDSSFAYTGKAAAANLKAELRKVVKDYGLNRMMSVGGGIPTGRGTVKMVGRIPAGAPVHPYLQGLTKIQERIPGHKKPISSQMLTWRIMSEKSPASSWQHPGISPANLLPLVEHWVDREMTNIVNSVMGSVTGV